jgi:predicted Holliday junction resolvase-like endonuclease
LLNTKSQLKDQILATKNVEIKLQTTLKQNEVLTEQNTRLQDQLNEALASQENLERDVNTQKEIMKQMESNRKEYIQKLKSDLLSVESRFT